MSNYRTVETTNLIGSKCYDFVSNKDIQNGAIVGKGALIDDSSNIYEAIDTFENGVFLVANPAWSYDNSSAESQNEENYTNKAGRPFRVYELKPNMKFKIGNVGNRFPIGNRIAYKAEDDSFEDKTTETANNKPLFRVINMETLGFPYCVGSFGISDNSYGFVADNTRLKYTIEYLAADVKYPESNGIKRKPLEVMSLNDPFTDGYTAGDFIGGDISIDENGAVTGTIKKVENMPLFGKTGHFFPVRLNAQYAGKEITATGMNGEHKGKDLEWLIQVTESTTVTFQESEKAIAKLTFTGATFEGGTDGEASDNEQESE